MQVYNIVEQHDLFTRYEKVDIEDVEDDFITEEEYENFSNDYDNTIISNRNFINKSAIDNLIHKAVDKFKNLPKNKVTVGFEYDFGNVHVKNYFNIIFETRYGLKVSGNRIRKIVKTTFKKPNVRKSIFELFEGYLQQIMGMDIVLKSKHLKANQIKFVELTLKLGVTYNDLIIFKNMSIRSNCYYSSDFNDKDGQKYAKSWFNDTVKTIKKSK